MKNKTVKATVLSAFCSFLITQNSYGTSIADSYIGGIQFGTTVYSTLPSGPIPDVLGGDNRYDLSSISVTFTSSGYTQIDIYGNYFSHVTVNDHIDLGDLFLSNNGWNPVTPSNADTYQYGEFWEFALVLNDHTGQTSSGVATLYSIDNISDYILAENATTSSTKRFGQEVLLNTTTSTVVGSGTWELFSDHLTFVVSTTLLNLGSEDLGVRWTMTCANDIIEGSAPVPEPATIFLFGAGLTSLVALKKRRKLQ